MHTACVALTGSLDTHVCSSSRSRACSRLCIRVLSARLRMVSVPSGILFLYFFPSQGVPSVAQRNLPHSAHLAAGAPPLPMPRAAKPLRWDLPGVLPDMPAICAPPPRPCTCLLCLQRGTLLPLSPLFHLAVSACLHVRPEPLDSRDGHHCQGSLREGARERPSRRRAAAPRALHPLRLLSAFPARVSSPPTPLPRESTLVRRASLRLRLHTLCDCCGSSPPPHPALEEPGEEFKLLAVVVMGRGSGHDLAIGTYLGLDTFSTKPVEVAQGKVHNPGNYIMGR